MEVDDVKEGLPEGLFAMDRFPSEKVNMYSTVENLLVVRDALNRTQEMSTVNALISFVLLCFCRKKNSMFTCRATSGGRIR